jgi:hypothetical protein
MRRVGLLVVVVLAALSALPPLAAARGPGLARIVGSGDVDVNAQPRAQVFGEVEGGRVLWQGRGTPPPVVSCADARELPTCATRRRARGNAWEWRLKAPVRIFVLGREYRLFVGGADRVALSITGSASLAVEGTGILTVPGSEPRPYDGYQLVQVAPTRRVGG